MYFFIGKSIPWSAGDGGGGTASDTIPPQPINNLNSENGIWRNMLSLKRILRSDVSSGIKKRTWTYGSYYDIYRHDYGDVGVTGVSDIGNSTTPPSLADARYYVVTENGNVYICIGNNRRQNASTDNPQNYGTGIGFANFTTSDGYIWKFITSISPTDYAKFSTLEFHPVKNVTVQPVIGDPYEAQYLAQETAKSKGGAIFNILVAAAGTSSFVSTTIGTLINQTGINVKGDGSGLKIAISTNVNGGVQTITVLDPGVNYTYANITLDGFIGTSLTPIYTPRYGLGANPIVDLTAYYLLVNTKLSYAEGDGDFTVANDYRQIGLITNPRQLNGSLATSSTLDASISLVVNSTTAVFAADAEIVNNTNGSIARIIDWDPVGAVLRVNLPKPSNIDNWSTYSGFSASQTISQIGGPGSTQNITITSVIDPEVQSFSGNVIYFENRRPIQRDAQQIESVSLSIEY
jgi:hypothetical protein